jgi:hypothetical protein
MSTRLSGRAVLAATLAAAPLGARAADEFRVEELRQEITELQRVTREQSRRIDELERLVAKSARTPIAPLPGNAHARALPGSDKWLAPTSWKRVRPGMNEQQVLDLLGCPTSVRNGPGEPGRTWFYTMQVGPSGFLSGRVVLSNNQVREVQEPTLR